jgi:hypothetical protein
MSDLETPQADMMRDQSSLDAAPATLRPEELQPGLDCESAPNSVLIHNRFRSARWTLSHP